MARAVRYCDVQQCGLEQLTVAQLQDALKLAELGYSDELVNDELCAVLTLEGSLQARNHIGGTNPEQVKAAAAETRKRLGL